MQGGGSRRRGKNQEGIVKILSSKSLELTYSTNTVILCVILHHITFPENKLNAAHGTSPQSLGIHVLV